MFISSSRSGCCQHRQKETEIDQADKSPHQEEDGRFDQFAEQGHAAVELVLRADRGVCVECRQDQMPGQRAFDGDVRRLRVADLADHDDIGVVPQNAAQGFRKGDALAINLNLVDAVEGNFDWVLNG